MKAHLALTLGLLAACSQGNEDLFGQPPSQPPVNRPDGSVGEGDGGGSPGGDGDLAGDGDGDGDGDLAGGDGDGDLGGDGGSRVCGALHAVVRDFQDSHPDFEKYEGSMATTGLVLPELGTDNTPVHASQAATNQTSGPEAFAQWYHDTAGVNQRVDIEIELMDNGAGLFVYDNSEFFPIDDQGFGNQGRAHNFHFTTEVHARFTYRGGEVFTFTGDDDLWLFVNGRLAIDLGGLHPALSATADFDALASQLGIVPGNEYPMDIFHAERHTTQSNFRVETSIDCFVPVL